MSFDSPLALLSLGLLPALVVGEALLRRRRARYAVRYTNLDVLAEVRVSLSRRRERLSLALALLALGLLCVAVARPHALRTGTVDNATVLLVVDTSRSMLSDDVAPTRLGAAKAAAAAFLERVEDRLRVGLVTFSGQVSIAATPTHDRQRLRESIAAISPFTAGRGTAIGDALARSVELLREAFAVPGAPRSRSGPIPGAEGAASVLFLSDGRQYLGVLWPEQGAELAREAGVPVYTVALGTDRQDTGGAFGGFGFNRAPDRPTLRAIARTTGGEYFAARSAEALSAAYDDLGSRLGRAKRRTEVTALFVAGAAVALAAAGALARAWEPALP